jgi:undecaprenyl-diphosphatase
VAHVWAVILGLVQGLAEFLPISSTAHLKLIPWIFGIERSYPFLANAAAAQAFDIALHAGSFIAIFVALWADWLDLARGAIKREAQSLRFIGFLLVTSIPGAIFGVLLDKKIEVYSSPADFHSAPLIVGVALILFGVLLWAVDYFVSSQHPLQEMSWAKAGLIGLAQALALVPGVSRSGATMTAGRALGFSREAVARYSFMAALPIIGGAAVWGLRDVPLSMLLSLDWVLGFLAAAVSSFVFMKWMLAYVRKHSFAVFMWYRIALGVFVIGLFLIRG